MALGLNVLNLFYKFKVLVLVTLFVMVLWTTFGYLVDTRQELPKAKIMVEFFRKVTSLEHSQKEEKIESTAGVPMVKSFQSPCPALSPYLRGARKLSFKPSVTLEEVQKENPQVAKGRYHPVECSALQHVAILIPHRNREKHLLYLLQNLHPFLQRQQLDYGIYVIHQAGNTKFNRAKLLNVGYLEAIKEANWDCFIFHDVDLVPENDFNIYMCDTQPKHLVVGRNNTGYRVEMQKMKVVRPPADVARYTMIFHNRDHGNEENRERMKLLRQVSRTWKTDGLNSCSYKLLSVEHNALYINITVDFSVQPKVS
ncbi:beta-1,4-galactosyltransferase 4 isoform X2 [Cyanistes caeruleus]|uniref:beta-1,4-galactosyltransferase 4 isoform X2 n=1 Tax=Cyanistes caeruleus TaxID=156563 RepID=UPI000CDB3610|nr:beta-1,4-galactosyltransferase 4 isoform X2 [Cyanistes caeruleus]